MNSSQALQRANKAAQESQARYKLGKGGYDPSYPLPEKDGVDQCDCSGFVAWTLGIKRQNAGIPGGWIETSLIVRDATTTRKMFEQVDVPLPGYVIVYGDKGKRQGHIGIISAVTDGKVTEVIHCSTGNDRRLGRAIAATGPEVFIKGGAIYARPLFLDPDTNESPNEKDCTP